MGPEAEPRSDARGARARFRRIGVSVVVLVVALAWVVVGCGGLELPLPSFSPGGGVGSRHSDHAVPRVLGLLRRLGPAISVLAALGMGVGLVALLLAWRRRWWSRSIALGLVMLAALPVVPHVASLGQRLYVQWDYLRGPVPLVLGTAQERAALEVVMLRVYLEGGRVEVRPMFARETLRVSDGCLDLARVVWLEVDGAPGPRPLPGVPTYGACARGLTYAMGSAPPWAHGGAVRLALRGLVDPLACEGAEVCTVNLAYEAACDGWWWAAAPPDG